MKNNVIVNFLRNFYKDKKALVTGVHGFKGIWLALLLKELGAEVVGCGLQADDGLLFDLIDLSELDIDVKKIDVRDPKLIEYVKDVNPDILFHLAAQPIVSVGYDDPYLTYSTNVIGTVNFLESIRKLDKKVSAINITTDKVYLNVDKNEPYLESDTLMGEDPYSSSKSCSELVTFSYQKSFFEPVPEFTKIVSTCRAGNVIGGGDFALNRIVPDLVRGLKNRTSVNIRNFNGIRPYQHVLDAVYAYAILAAVQYDDDSFYGDYNIGPNDESVMRTKEITDFFEENTDVKIIDGSEGKTFHEANILKLDSSKFRKSFDWQPIWGSKKEMLSKTLEWYNVWINNDDVLNITLKQIREFLND